MATPGQTLGRYCIIEQLGAGGMGVVYRARDERLERDVALKLLPAGTLADEAARRRFRQEALALSQLNHPNIATIHDFDSQSGVDFLAMEYIQGTTLDCKLIAGALAEKEVLSLGGQLASGLAAAHERGVVHRDLKPGNLGLTPDGRLKILDFGLAKLLPPGPASVGMETVSQTQHVLAGTLPYMAPEQLLGEAVDMRTDIYAMGAVLYEMATGRPPFPEEQPSRLTDAILRQTPVPVRNLNPRISPQLEAIILKCLEKDAENRYQSAKEARVDLRRAGASSEEVLRAVPKRAAWYRLSAVLGAVAITGLLFSLNVGGMRNRLLGGAASASRITSLAVLPLDNFSHDPEQEFFADGMTEELITELAQVHALRVISRTSVMSYKSTHKSLPEIGRELHVDAIVAGSVLRSGDRVRITAQLVEAATDRHLWAKSFDRDLRDVLSLQADVARNIAHEIQANVTPKEEARLARSRPVKPAAHEDYLKGLYYWHQFTDQGMKKATEYFQQAIAEDPDYAPAYVGLADAYHESANAPPNELMPKAKATILKALELDSMSGDAHATLGWIKWVYDWDWPGAELEFRLSIELEPNASGPAKYADYLDAMGRFEEGMRQHQRAMELDPLSLINSSNTASAFYLAHQYDRAIEHFKKTLDIDRGFAGAHMFLADCYWLTGTYNEYVTELQEGLRLNGLEQQAEEVGRAYKSSGAKGAAKSQLQSLRRRRSQGYVPASSIAAGYLRLGDKDNAVAWLEKAYEERDPELAWARVEPVWDGLRSEPRFIALMHRLGFS